MLSVSLTPFPVLETPRLLLRSIQMEDAALLFKLRTDAEAMKYLDKAPMQDLDEALALIEKILSHAEQNEGINWVVARKESPEILMGTIGYWRFMKEHYRAEIGYMLLPAYFRNGYMKEAITEVIHFGFNTLKLHSIEANTNPENIASHALLKSVGFNQEALFKENYYYDGQFFDSAIYSLIDHKK